MSNWNTTVKCIEEFNPGKGATLGQTYKVVNGRITYDNGDSSMNEFESLEEINRGNKAKFKEISKRGRPKKEV